MISLLKSWKGAVEINGKTYENIQDATSDFKTFSGDIHIILHSAQKNATESVRERVEVESVEGETEYRITVKQYMTQEATPSFDFMAKWNNNKPMPIRTMVGTVEKETRGMVYMKLHGLAQETVTCMCCGRDLTNPVSRHYGIGPICMSKIGISRDIDDIENIKDDLVNITWEGWVIKSSFLKKELI